MRLPGGAVVKNLPAMQETQVRSLGRGDPLEEGLAPTPVFLPGKIPWTEEPGRLQSMGSQRIQQNLTTEQACMLIVISGKTKSEGPFVNI